jgi:hypothetical protein
MTIERRGRPRKHSSDSERIAAHRQRHGFKKVSVDVPEEMAPAILEFAQKLRETQYDAKNTGGQRKYANLNPDNFLSTRRDITSSIYWEKCGDTYYLHEVSPFYMARITKNGEKYFWSISCGSPYKLEANGSHSRLFFCKRLVHNIMRMHLYFCFPHMP